MRISEYAVRSLALRQELRSSSRALAFVFEVGRGAAIMALVLVVADAARFGILADNPVRRLGFIGLWALFMAGVEALRAPAGLSDTHERL